MRSLWRGFPGTLLTLIALVVVGTVVMGYILIHQRAPRPFANTYTIRAELPSADGVTPGSGQPVKVAGVPVGVISGVAVTDGVATVTLRINRDDLPDVHRDATATLRPISPLKDLQLVLDPGTRSAGSLGEGTIPLERGTSPADLRDLLAALDGDTRDFLTMLVNSIGAGTADQGVSMRKALRALAPTTSQARQIAAAMDDRRRQISRLVSNISIVARAGTDDQQLAQLVAAGNATLGAVAREDKPLRAAVAELPRTTTAIDDALPSVKALADELIPTVDALQPAARRLAPAERNLRPFSARAAAALRRNIRPFVRGASPVLQDFSGAVGHLTKATPDLDSTSRTLTYFTNELTYNPPGDDEGSLFWIPWAGHNVLSAASTADANGALIRATAFVSCGLPQGLPGVGALVADALNATPLCESAAGKTTP